MANCHVLTVKATFTPYLLMTMLFVVCLRPLQTVWDLDQARSRLKLFQTLTVFLKYFFEKDDFEKKISRREKKA